MDVTLSTKEFMELQQCMTAKDIEIVRLKEQIAQSKAECDLWKSRALNAEAILQADKDGLDVEEIVNAVSGERKMGSGGVIVLSIELLKSVLAKIHNLKILAVIGLVLQKTLHRGASAEESRQIAEMIPLPELPSIKLTAEGDIDVEGDWNDIHNNGNVQL